MMESLSQKRWNWRVYFLQRVENQPAVRRVEAAH
jgi:hypothetical protein